MLTDQTGTAICNAILGSTIGVGSFYALVGGVNPNISGAEPAFFATGNYNLNVTPGIAAMLSVNGGTGQSANPGQPLAGALVATVGDRSGNPLASQPVVWTVSPAGAATLSNTSRTLPMRAAMLQPTSLWLHRYRHCPGQGCPCQ